MYASIVNTKVRLAIACRGCPKKDVVLERLKGYHFYQSLSPLSDSAQRNVRSIPEEINGGGTHQAGFDFRLQNLGCTLAELFLLHKQNLGVRGNHRCFRLVLLV